jgi:FkbM family methyltransferase
MKDLLVALYAYIFSRPVFRRLNENIVKLGLKGLGFLFSHDAESNGELFFLRMLFKNSDVTTIFDVGANAGNYAIQCYNAGFKGNIYCFEPHPKTFDKLSHSLAKSSVKLFNFGFSNTQGKADIYDHMIDDGSEHASLYEDVIRTIHKDNVVKHEIILTTIDQFVTDNNIDRIDLLKIDTEGNEFNVLLGASGTLRNKQIDIIHFEFNEMNTISRVFMKDFVEYLSNYDLYRLLPRGILKITYGSSLLNEIFAYQNIVAIRKDSNRLNLK